MKPTIRDLYDSFIAEGTRIASIEDAQNYLTENFHLSKAEVQDLLHLGHGYIHSQVSKELLVALERSGLESDVVGVFITAFLFGMYVCEHMGWGWEDVPLI